jgi:hypothetical protein
MFMFSGLCLFAAAPLSLPPAARADDPPAASGTRTITYDTFRDRMRGGWAGQMIGVSNGSVYEFRALGRTIDGPLRPWKPEYVENSLQQDDLYVEMTFLKVLEVRGVDATDEQVGAAFRDSRYRLWHANDAGRTNPKAGILPPDSGHPRNNPHSDDIDFQIEADLFGLVAPGLPAAAGRLCDRFGHIMNYGDGLYGGRFVAAMYARAYLEAGPSPEVVARVIDAGLAAIPAASGYARLVRDVLAWHREDPNDWRATWQKLEASWASDDRCPEGLGRPFNIDAKLNGGYVVLGLLHGGGDLSRTLEITIRCGQDADCNPSTAAGVLGALYGYSRIPGRYTAAIPGLVGRRFEFTEYDFPGLIAACERVAAGLIEREGGRIVGRDGMRKIVLSEQAPSPPAGLEQLTAFPAEDLAGWREEFASRKARGQHLRP